jgi:long-chain acyl-CoA synthetase
MPLPPSSDKPWLAAYDEGVPPGLDYEEIFVFEYLERAARGAPRSTAVRFAGRSTSYRELSRQALSIAAKLREHGLRPGDRVAIMLPNMPQAVAAYFGVLRAGGVCVMTNPLYMESELTYQLGDADCRHMILLDHLWPKIEKVRGKLPVEKYYVTGISEALGFPGNQLYKLKAKKQGRHLGAPYDGESVLPWKELLRGGEPGVHGLSDPKKDLALIQYTGGTTGKPKGVMITHFNLAANLQQCHAILHSIRKGHEVFLAVMPFFHVYGLTTCLNLAVSVSGSVVCVPRFESGELLKTIHKEKPTVFPGAPAVYDTLIKREDVGDYGLKSINFLVSGSAPLSHETMRRFQDLTEAAIIEGYGLTETSPVTHLNPLKGERKLGTIGLPFPDTDCLIADLNDGMEPLPQGREGELLIRGPQVSSGYWNKPEETAETFRDGWLRTGDVAVMDEQGYFTITDRKKDMVIVGGYNVYPREVDEVLLHHPGISEAACVGVSHPTHGEIVKAYLVPMDGAELHKNEIVAFCREKLASYKVPRRVEIVPELPKTSIGKVKKHELRGRL